MPTVSEEKWPVEMQLVPISNSVLEEFNLYFLSGLVNGNQLETLQRRLPVLSVFEIESDRFAFSTLVNERQLRAVYDEFIRLAKEWRGQYYALANKFVDVCTPALAKKE